MPQDSWQDRAAAKVADTASKIPKKWRITQRDRDQVPRQRKLTGAFIESFLSPGEDAIVHLRTEDLRDRIASGSLKCSEVVEAYCKTAAIAQQINNCMHEIFFDKAIYRASELDQYFEKHGRPIGPLHGVPVSLKDQFHVRGVDTTMGYVGWIGNFEGHANDAVSHNIQSQVVDELLMQGAVIYCKTSLPQTLMCGETINNIIGQTLNPVNQELSCGGSSGGEGALQALRGSSVGLGTDVGGSVRIPAAFCGTYSLKPTHDRLSYRHVANTNPGQLNGPSAVGIMGTSIGSLKLVMSALLSSEPWSRDPNVVPIPWRHTIEHETLSRTDEHGQAGENAALKIGLLYDDGFMRPHPPVIRGLRIVQEALARSGHQVIDWNPPSHHDAAQIHLRFLQSDGGYDIHKQLDISGEPLIPPLREIFELKPPFSAVKTQELAIEARDSCEAYLDYWNSLTADDGREVDAFIMPVAPHAAVMPGRYLYTGYTEVVNLLDYSAAVLPVTLADKHVDVVDTHYVPMNELDEKNWKWYDPDAYDGAPVGLQIVCKRYEEEKVWAIAQIVDTILKARVEN